MSREIAIASTSEVFLVLLETAGNQDYVYSSNKLRQNLGASELIYRSGTRWILEAVGLLSKTASQGGVMLPDPIGTFRGLLSESENPRVDSWIALTKGTEVVVATSGKAVLITRTKEEAGRLIRNVTERACREAPGLEITGVYLKMDWLNDDLHRKVGDIHALLADHRGKLPSQATRFPFAPMVAQCQTTKLPAARLDWTPDKTLAPRSKVALTQRDAREEFWKRMSGSVEDGSLQTPFLHWATLEEDGELSDQNWIGVIHADGNSFGAAFLDLKNKVGAKTNAEYSAAYREFSIALEVLTLCAFGEACKHLHVGMDRIGVVPLLLGGDDLTVICSGQKAVLFTAKYLEAFERLSQEPELRGVDTSILQTIARGLTSETLTAAAGVAVVKGHYPYHMAYQLAEQLCKQAKDDAAKAGERTCSALSFLVNFDSSVTDLNDVISELTLPGGSRLYARPYVVGHADDGKVSRSFKAFQEKVDLLEEKDDEGLRRVSSAKLHQWRELLFAGHSLAETAYENDCPSHLAKIPLFSAGDDKVRRTWLLDAMEMQDFLG